MPVIQSFSSIESVRLLWWRQCSRYLFSKPNAPTFQNVDVIFTVIHEATDQTVITENDGCHLGDVLVTLVLSDVASVIHQAGNQVTFSNWFISTLFDLLKGKWLFYTIILFSYQTTFTKERMIFSCFFFRGRKRKTLRNACVLKKIVCHAYSDRCTF